MKMLTWVRNLLGSRREEDDEWETLSARVGPVETRLIDQSLRLFDKDHSPSLRLWRDNSAWCPFCTMTLMLLESMRLSYAVKTIPLTAYMLPGQTKDPEYVRMVPDGIVPGIQHKKGTGFEKAFRGVYAIFDDLRRRYPERYPLGPDASVHDAIVGEKGIVGQLERARYLRNPSHVREPLAKLEALIKGPFVQGDTVTAADLQLLPFLERIRAHSLYFYGDDALKPFAKAGALLDHAWTHSIYRYFGSDVTTLGRSVLRYAPDLPRSPQADAIDGVRLDVRAKWLSQASEQARAAAAAKLVQNHIRVAKFALRSAKLKSEKYDEIDGCLHAIATHLLDNSIDYAAFAATVSDKMTAAAALTALSLNVGVPRDLSTEAANALRAHCSTLAIQLEDNTGESGLVSV